MSSMYGSDVHESNQREPTGLEVEAIPSEEASGDRHGDVRLRAGRGTILLAMGLCAAVVGASMGGGGDGGGGTGGGKAAVGTDVLTRLHQLGWTSGIEASPESETGDHEVAETGDWDQQGQLAPDQDLTGSAAILQQARVNDGTWDSDGVTLTKVSLESFLEGRGYDTSAMYFPDQMVVSRDHDLLEEQGELVQDGGLIAFSIAYFHRPVSTVNASYTVVMYLDGTISNVLVHTSDMCATDAHQGSVPRIRALKVFSETQLMLGLHCGETAFEIGPHVLWDFSDGNGRWETFAGGEYRSSHDMEIMSDSMMLSPTTDHRDVEVYDVKTGERYFKYLVWNETIETWYPGGELAGTMAPDINHCQLADGKLLISLRYCDTLMLVDWEKAASSVIDSIEGSGSTDDDGYGVTWFAGGPNSTYTQYKIDGSTLAEGETSLFYGQHNPEIVKITDGYIYDIMMFDNGYSTIQDTHYHDTSRLLTVQVNEKEGSVKETWAYNLSHYSPIYGDADMTPSSNVVANSWPQTLTDTAAFDYQALLVVPKSNAMGGRVGWALRVYDELEMHGCTGYPCARSDGDRPEGWAGYSVERFFEKPIVDSVTCSDGKLKIKGIYDVSKWSNYQPGHVFVYKDSSANRIKELDTDFTFSLFNAATEVTIDDSSILVDGLVVRVEVQNRFKQMNSLTATCS